jgi:hypothetical protein
MRARDRASVAAAVLLSAACGRAPAPSPSPAAGAVPTATPDPLRPLPSPLPTVAGRVNGEDIPTRNVAIMVVESIELGRAPESRRNALFREALDQLIKREVLLQEASARGVKADDLEVQRAYDRMRGEHRDEAAWTAFLKDRSLTDELLRAELRTRFTVQALLQKEAAKQTVTASEEEARAFYDTLDGAAFQPGAASPKPGATPAPKPPFEAVEEAMRQEVMRRKYADLSERFVQSLLAKAKVEKFLGPAPACPATALGRRSTSGSRACTARSGPGGGGGRTSPSARGAPSARTTAPTARPGTTSRTTWRGARRIAGARTGSPASATATSSCASRWRCGTSAIPSSRSGSSASSPRKATTART